MDWPEGYVWLLWMVISGTSSAPGLDWILVNA